MDNVLLILPPKKYGGMETSFECLITFLQKNLGLRVTCITQAGGPNKTEYNADTSIVLPRKRIPGYIFSSVCRKRYCAIICGNSSSLLFALLFSFLPIPIISQVHCTLEHSPLSIFRRGITKAFLAIASYRAYVTTVSRGLQLEISRIPFIRRKAVKFVPNIVPWGSNQYEFTTETADIWRDRNIYWVGRLSDQKDPKRALAAFIHLLDIEPKYEGEFIIVGDGPQLDELKRLVAVAALSDRVRFRGWKKDPFSDKPGILLFTSVYEGYGLVLVEAFLRGYAVVATRSPHGPGEIMDKISPDYLLPVDATPEACADKLLKLLTRGVAEEQTKTLRMCRHYIGEQHECTRKFYARLMRKES